jgi:hypothetical protein
MLDRTVKTELKDTCFFFSTIVTADYEGRKLLNDNISSRMLNKQSSDYLFINTYFITVVKQPYGYNVTGQLQEPKDLIRPATAKIVSVL